MERSRWRMFWRRWYLILLPVVVVAALTRRNCWRRSGVGAAAGIR
jgi:hypothetical protein